MSPSKTKKYDQSANTKCRNSDLYGEMGMRKGGMLFFKDEKAPDAQIFPAVSFVTHAVLEKN